MVGTMSFRAWLRELKKREGWTERQMAEMFKVTQPAVHFWLTGHSLPELSSCGYISEATGTPLADIAEMVRRDAREPTVTGIR